MRARQLAQERGTLVVAAWPPHRPTSVSRRQRQLGSIGEHPHRYTVTTKAAYDSQGPIISTEH
jgi:hypothetical protein